VFAVRSRRKERPDDLIDEEAWDGQFALPTDVLLRTTTKQGRMASDMYDQWGAWVSATPLEPRESEFMFAPAVDAVDEFHASPFVAAHGWYRQATAALRNALETMVLAAAFAVRADKRGFADWRGNAGEPPRFGNMVDILAKDTQIASFDIKLGLPGLFVRKPPGVVQDIYENLCRYAHSRPGHTNVDICNLTGRFMFQELSRSFGSTSVTRSHFVTCYSTLVGLHLDCPIVHGLCMVQRVPVGTNWGVG